MVVYGVAATILSALWLWFWLWIGWMAVRVLRWTYLEKKHAWREAADLDYQDYRADLAAKR
jgi:hypothetical protein